MRDAGRDRPARVLVVEDEPLIGLEVVFILEDAGYLPLGPARDVASALRIIDDEAPDCGVLDINLGRDTTSAPIARRLTALGIPYIYLSSYGENFLAGDLPHARMLPKPVDPSALAQALAGLLDNATP